MARKDVRPEQSAELDWAAEHAKQSLLKVFKRAEHHALTAIEWYLIAKRSKKNWAQGLRFGVIFLTAIAGLLPIVSQMKQLPFVIEPAWASVAIGLAGMFLALDRFFGFSSGWMRFIATEHQIRQLLHEFQMDCETEKVSWRDGSPDYTQVQKGLVRSKTFLTQVDDLIRKETDKWLAEFQDSIKQIDEAARAKAVLTESGGVNITVTNGDKAQGGWKLSVDKQEASSYTGKTAALASLSATTHLFRIEGVIGGAPKVEEKAIIVASGRVVDVEITL